MVEPVSFVRNSPTVSYPSLQSSVSAVDPSRIQALLGMILISPCIIFSTAQACTNCSRSDRCADPLQPLEALLTSLKSNSDSHEASLASTLSTGMYLGLLDYLCDGGNLPSAVNSNSGSALLVFINGFDHPYLLKEDDLYKVFTRYGNVVNVSLCEDFTNAVITMGSQFQAERATRDLDGKLLTGLAGGSLRVIPYSWGGSSGTSVPMIRKYTCRFDIQIENDKEFHVARRIIGQKGSNMKRIVKQAGYDAKLRLRGRGSGFLEGAQKQESQEPLHLCVSCKDVQGYRSAVRQVEDLLEEIYLEYSEYCQMRGQTYPPDLGVIMHEHPLMFQASSGGNESGQVLLSPPTTPHGPPVMEILAREDAEIEKLIEQRNEARRICNFKEADRIRDILRTRGIGLMDEPGGRGRGTDVTTWRFWR